MVGSLAQLALNGLEFQFSSSLWADDLVEARFQVLQLFPSGLEADLTHAQFDVVEPVEVGVPVPGESWRFEDVTCDAVIGLRSSSDVRRHLEEGGNVGHYGEVVGFVQVSIDETESSVGSEDRALRFGDGGLLRLHFGEELRDLVVGSG